MKKKISLFGLGFMVASLAISSCTVKQKEPDEEKKPDPIINEVETKYGLTVSAPTGAIVSFLEGVSSDSKLSGGQLVKFKIELTDATKTKVDEVTIEDIPVSKDSEGIYSFRMPNVDGALLKVTVADIVEDIVEVADVDETTIPTLAEADYSDSEKVTAAYDAIKAMFTKADEVEPQYLKRGRLDETGSTSGTMLGVSPTNMSGMSNHVTFEAGKDNIRFSNAYGLSLTGSPKYKYFEKGIYGSKYYTSNISQVYDKAGPKITNSDSFSYYSIVKDEDAYTTNEDGTKTKNYSSSETSESEAKANVRKTGALANFARNRFGSDSNSFNYALSSSATTTTVNEILAFEHTIAEDKKSYTFHLKTGVTYTSSYSNSYTIFEGSFVVDGNQYIRSIDFTKDEYDYADYDKEAKTIKSGAVAKSQVTAKLINEVGNVNESQTPTDISKLAMHDYDVQLTYKMSYDSGYSYGRYMLAGEDMESCVVVSLESTHYISHDNENGTGYEGAILPTFKGIKEGDEEIVDYNTKSKTLTPKKTGTIHLIYDNGFGEIKEIPVNIIQALPYSMSASLADASGKAYFYDDVIGTDDGKFTVTASITPDTASQEIEYALDDNNVTGATVTAGADTDKGEKTLIITPTKVGDGTITLKSKVDGSIKETLTFQVLAKPTLAEAKANLTSKTLRFDSTVCSTSSPSSWTTVYHPFVNFNEDGTGKLALPYTKDSAFSSYQVSTYVGEFTWTLDETTLAVTITQKTGINYSYYFKEFTILGNTLFKGKFMYSSYYTFEDTFTLVDRIDDFSTAKFTW